jgi:diguanylate cyclase (GGDEF)-like protein
MEPELSDSPPHALLVEDDLEYAAMLHMLLAGGAAPAIRINHVTQLEEALHCLNDKAFDVILLDLSLPDSQGFDTFTRVINQVPHLPVVVMTALKDESLALRAVREGAQDYIVKGEMEAAQLLRAIHFAIERHRSTEQVRKLTLVDELTGLLNRRGFYSMGKQHIQIARRASRQLVLFYIDLDGLKSINDQFGHFEGDQALMQIASILKETFRSSDLIARLGGDEFTVLAIDAVRDSIDNMLSRLEANLRSANLKNPRYQLSLSTGFARFDPQGSPDLEKLLVEADEAMYDYKQDSGER